MIRLRLFLVDDEPLALKRLERLLSQRNDVEVVGASRDPVQAIRQMQQRAYDVLFTYIQMPELSGFQMLTHLKPQPLVVFTTAYSEYALRAFDVHSVDYLVKPIEENQLDRALQKLKRMRNGLQSPLDIENLLRQLTSALPPPREYSSRLPSRTGDRVEFVDVAHVTHFYANEKLTYAATAKKAYAVDSTIAELEASLDPSRFVRVHRSTIVNLHFVVEVYSWFSDRMMVRINDGKGTELTVARDRVKSLKAKLGL